MVIAVDFDGTLCVNKFPEIGEPKHKIIDMCIFLQNQGHKLILWTSREGERLKEAVNWCADRGLVFDAINDALPEQKEAWQNETRKIWADIYVDDKSIQPDKASMLTTEASMTKACTPETQKTEGGSRMRAASEIITDLKDGKQVPYEELKIACLVQSTVIYLYQQNTKALLKGGVSADLLKQAEYSNAKTSSKEMGIPSWCWNALKKDPIEWLGPQRIPGTKEWEEMHAFAPKT